MTKASSLLESLSELTNEAAKPDEHGFIAGNKAHNVKNAIKHIEKLGHVGEIMRKPGSLTAAIYSNGKIHVNASHKYWTDPVAGQKYGHSTGHQSSDHPLHVIYHEVGHAEYDAPDNFVTNNEREKIQKEVSKYACMNPKELVAEVRAGQRAGRTFPPEIMSMFNRYAKKREGMPIGDEHLPPHLKNLKS